MAEPPKRCPRCTSRYWFVAEPIERGLAAFRSVAVGLPTARQVEILAHKAAHGLTYKETAKHFGVTPSTVKRHLEETLRTLGAQSETQATLRLLMLCRRG